MIKQAFFAICALPWITACVVTPDWQLLEGRRDAALLQPEDFDTKAWLEATSNLFGGQAFEQAQSDESRLQILQAAVANGSLQYLPQVEELQAFVARRCNSGHMSMVVDVHQALEQIESQHSQLLTPELELDLQDASSKADGMGAALEASTDPGATAGGSGSGVTLPPVEVSSLLDQTLNIVDGVESVGVPVPPLTRDRIACNAAIQTTSFHFETTCGIDADGVRDLFDHIRDVLGRINTGRELTLEDVQELVQTRGRMIELATTLVRDANEETDRLVARCLR